MAEVNGRGHTISPTAMYSIFCFTSIVPTIPMIWPIIYFTAKTFFLNNICQKSFQENYNITLVEKHDYGDTAAKFQSDWMSGTSKDWALQWQGYLLDRQTILPRTYIDHVTSKGNWCQGFPREVAKLIHPWWGTWSKTITPLVIRCESMKHELVEYRRLRAVVM